MERISKLMSLRGMCSRREADRYIQAGQVRVNGEVVSELGTRAPEDAEIELLPEARRAQRMKRTILLHKPLGVVSHVPQKGYQEASELITAENQIGGGDLPTAEEMQQMGVVGRLDIDSKGLLLFSEDGVLVRKVIGPDSDVEKEYLVRVDGEITAEILAQLRFGLRLDGQVLKRAQVEQMAPQLLRIILRQGKKRQIRRMCELVGLKVEKLKRVRVGNLRLGKLPMGKWRYLAPNETV